MIGGRLLAMYAKRPVPGQVKSRLAQGIGDERAAQLYTRMLDRLVARFDRGAREHGFAFHLHVDPVEAVEWFRRRYPTMRGRIFAQHPHADLGDRMLASFDRGFAQGFRAVALCCSDAPDLDPRHGAEAFVRLRSHDAVLGPATDGGYYLIGWRRRMPQMFAGMEWSQANVLAETRLRAEAAGISLALLDPLLDIDHASDLLALTPGQRTDLLPPGRPSLA
jgi:rSAM/selenodomain-associated transferase 1